MATLGPLRALIDGLEADRERWPLWLPVGMIAGIALYFSLPREPAPLAGPAAVVVLLLLAAALRHRPGLLAVAVAALSASPLSRPRPPGSAGPC